MITREASCDFSTINSFNFTDVFIRCKLSSWLDQGERGGEEREEGGGGEEREEGGGEMEEGKGERG